MLIGKCSGHNVTVWLLATIPLQMAGKKEKGGQFFLVNTDDEWLAAMEKEVMVKSTNHLFCLDMGS